MNVFLKKKMFYAHKLIRNILQDFMETQFLHLSHMAWRANELFGKTNRRSYNKRRDPALMHCEQPIPYSIWSKYLTNHFYSTQKRTGNPAREPTFTAENVSRSLL